MKIGIRLGHMESGPDGGAAKYIGEVEANRQYGKFVMDYLVMAGHEVINCTPTAAYSVADSLAQGVANANAHNVDVFISLHVNAGGGKGTECIYYPGSKTGKEYAERINNSIADKCGYYNRGAKGDVRGLYELKNTNMPAVIVEPFFVDSQSDADYFNPQQLGKAIAEGICGYEIRDKLNEDLFDRLSKYIHMEPEYWRENAAESKVCEGIYVRKIFERVLERLGG